MFFGLLARVANSYYIKYVAQVPFYQNSYFEVNEPQD